MAAKTFTITEAGATAGQALDDTTTSILIRGDLKGGILIVEASNADSNYVLVTDTESGGLKVDAVNAITLPAGWYARIVTILGTAAPTVTIVIE